MTQDEIIKMARHCGFSVAWPDVEKNFVAFAKLVAEREREACAEICDVLAVHPEYASSITKLAAQAIRNRRQA